MCRKEPLTRLPVASPDLYGCVMHRLARLIEYTAMLKK